MRRMKIVSDSSADLVHLKNAPFSAAPLKVITEVREFTDTPELDVEEMVNWFSGYKGKSKTSCPSPSDWLEAFGDGEDIFCVTITSGLSGSYNAAWAAKQLYEGEHPDRQVFVIDSLSAGPEMRLIVEKLEALIQAGESYREICGKITAYTRQTGLVFMLESLQNFAANGRVSPAVARIAGVLGIRIVGRASDKGTLEPTNKCPGENRALRALVDNMKKAGLCRGKVRIAHCCNLPAAEKLRELFYRELPQAQVEIHALRGLCSFYAEKGGILVGFEKY